MIDNIKDINVLRYKGRWNVIINKDFLFYNPKILKDKTKMLFLALKSFANPVNDVAFPSISLLTLSLGWNKETVYKNLKILREQNLIQIDKIRTKGMFSHNIYIIEDELEWLKKQLQ